MSIQRSSLFVGARHESMGKSVSFPVVHPTAGILMVYKPLTNDGPSMAPPTHRRAASDTHLSIGPKAAALLLKTESLPSRLSHLPTLHARKLPCLSEAPPPLAVDITPSHAPQASNEHPPRVNSRADVRIEIPRDEPSMPAAPPLRTTPLYSSAFLDAVAAALALITTRLSGYPDATKIVTVASGSFWMAAGAVNEFGNSPHSKILSGANFLTAVAGILDMVVPFVAGKTQQEAALGCNAAWAASGVAIAARALANSRRNVASRVLMATSGVTNAAAASLAMGSVHASAQGESGDALKLTVAAATAWALGAAATAASAWSASRDTTL